MSSQQKTIKLVKIRSICESRKFGVGATTLNELVKKSCKLMKVRDRLRIIFCLFSVLHVGRPVGYLRADENELFSQSEPVFYCIRALSVFSALSLSSIFSDSSGWLTCLPIWGWHRTDRGVFSLFTSQCGTSAAGQRGTLEWMWVNSLPGGSSALDILKCLPFSNDCII